MGWRISEPLGIVRDVKSFLVALVLLFILVACADAGPGGGSSGAPGGGGDGGADGGGGPSVDPQRSALCDQYASATASCCAQAPGTCPRTSAADWKSYCLGYASTCAAMPTCFRGGDCNTLIYCSVPC